MYSVDLVVDSSVCENVRRLGYGARGCAGTRPRRQGQATAGYAGLRQSQVACRFELCRRAARRGRSPRAVSRTGSRTQDTHTTQHNH